MAEMSRSSHPHGYLPFSSFPSPLYINSSTIPRSYNHSSDDSEAGSPSPSGGGSYAYPSDSSHEISSSQSQDDTPFVPRRGNRGQYQVGSTRTNVALSPDIHGYEYDHGNIPAHAPAGTYSNRDRGSYGSTYNQPTHQSGVFTGDRGQWKASHGSAPDSYYRPQVTYSPEQGYQSGLHPGSPHASYDLPRSSPDSSSHSSGYDGSTNAPVGFHPSAFVSAPDTEEYLRQQLNIPPFTRVDLWALPDPPPGQRPSQPLPVLIKLAIHGSPKHKLTLREIYMALEERFVWFRENREDKAWKGSIRHNLSLNKVFRNVQRPITEPGKGKYWILDITDGEGYKRERKRRNKKIRSGDGDDDDDDDELSDDEGSSSAGSPVPPSGSSSVTMQQEPQSGAHRVRSAPRNTSPYPQPAASSGAFTSPAGYSGGSIPSAASSQSYPRVDASSPQAAFGRAGFGEAAFRQPSFGQSSLSPGARAYSHPSIAQQGLRPNPPRAHTVPAPRAFSPTSGVYGMTPLQTASSPMMAPLRRSPEQQQQQQFPGYGSEISGYDAASMSSVGVPLQYGQGQYDPQMNMGRGHSYPHNQGGNGRGRSL